MNGVILRSDGGEGVFLESTAYMSLVGVLGRAGLVGGATLRRLEDGDRVTLRARDVGRIKAFLARVVGPNLCGGARRGIARDGALATGITDGLHGEHVVTLVRFLRRARGGVCVERRAGGGETGATDPYRPGWLPSTWPALRPAMACG